MESGRTKFPDILLFTDKVSGIIFNGWELKFPDTPVDDMAMLENALEKAKKLQSDSFVTWNGTQAVIWKINTDDYAVESLTKIKEYPKESTITTRDDLADPIKYVRNEPLLRQRADELLYDLGKLYLNGELKPAINITGNIVEAVYKASNVIIPQFQAAIIASKGSNADFRKEFNLWKIYENSTLRILASEMRGTSRNLGALDLNANYLKRLRILNPDLLSEQQKTNILNAFQPLKNREIEPIFTEVQKPDRINFDKTILRSFGMDERLLYNIYSLLTTSVNDRVSMHDR
jgi:hypothetical protein